jgi:hypothetical protein
VGILHPIADLEGMPVHIGDHQIGRVEALILDPVEDTALGFVIRSLSRRPYFLPLALAGIAHGHVAAASPLHLVEDVDYYRMHGRALSWDAAAGWLEPFSGHLVDESEQTGPRGVRMPAAAPTPRSPHAA